MGAIIILVCKGIKISVVHICHRVVLCNQSLYYNEVLYSLAKERPWVEHLTGLKEVGWVLFWVFSHLTTKECPCQLFYSDSMPLTHT